MRQLEVRFINVAQRRSDASRDQRPTPTRRSTAQRRGGVAMDVQRDRAGWKLETVDVEGSVQR